MHLTTAYEHETETSLPGYVIVWVNVLPNGSVQPIGDFRKFYFRDEYECAMRDLASGVSPDIVLTRNYGHT